LGLAAGLLGGIMLASLGAKLPATPDERRRICKFGGRCTYTQYGLTIRYSGPWKAEPTKFYKSDGKRYPAALVQDPKQLAPVAIGLAYGPISSRINPSSPEYTAYTGWLLDATRMPSLPGIWDVRVVVEGKSVYIDGFEAVEVLLADADYEKLQLVVDKPVPIGGQGIIPDFSLHGQHLMVGTNNQKAVHDVAGGQTWFRSKVAMQAHRIILGLSETSRQ
jgi:hypothetical protein